TAPPPPVTTAPPPPVAEVAVAQAFTATKAGSPIGMDTTITNNSTASKSVTVTLAVSGTGLPGFLEAKGTGWSCSNYIEKPGATATYTCSGSVSAKSSSVITVSSGSAIKAAVGTTYNATATVQPGGETASATATVS
ncbi:MAG: hypothetical protein AB7Q92_04365, partial [Acidimicrobiia bacterium]